MSPWFPIVQCSSTSLRLRRSRWDADKSFLVNTEIARCQHESETSGNKQWWGDQGEQERRQQISHQSTGTTSGSNIDIVTATADTPSGPNTDSGPGNLKRTGAGATKLVRILPIMMWECTESAVYTAVQVYSNWWSLPVADPARHPVHHLLGGGSTDNPSLLGVTMNMMGGHIY